jgi:hypothetical protein
VPFAEQSSQLAQSENALPQHSWSLGAVQRPRGVHKRSPATRHLHVMVAVSNAMSGDGQSHELVAVLSTVLPGHAVHAPFTQLVSVGHTRPH